MDSFDDFTSRIGWISVSSILPERSAVVLVFTREKRYCVAQLVEADRWLDFYERRPVSPDFWIPLPEVPEERPATPQKAVQPESNRLHLGQLDLD